MFHARKTVLIGLAAAIVAVAVLCVVFTKSPPRYRYVKPPGIERRFDSPMPRIAGSPDSLRSCRGQVVDSVTGLPIPAAKVEVLTYFIYPENVADGSYVLASATSDADGFYLLDYKTVRDGPGYFSPRIVARTPAYRIACLPLILASAPVINFSLSPAASISGKVLDEDGQPIQGALIGDRVGYAQAIDGDLYTSKIPYLFAMTNAEGVFTLDGVGDRNIYPMPVTAPGYAQSAIVRQPGDKGDLTAVLKRSTTSAMLTVTRNHQVTSNCLIQLEAEDTPGGGHSDEQTSIGIAGADGAYFFGGLRGGRYTVRVSAPPDAQNPSSNIEKLHLLIEQDKMTSLTIAVYAPIMAKGRFVDADTGAGVAGVRISSEDFDQNSSPGGYRHMIPIAPPPDRPETLSDANGFFLTPAQAQLDDAFGGSSKTKAILFYIPPDGFLSKSYPAITVDLSNPPANVFPLKHALGFPLRVFGPDGTPERGVSITVKEELDGRACNTRATVTDASGAVTVYLAPNKAYRAIAVSDSGSAVATISGSSSQELRIDLQPLCTVKGRVCSGGSPMPAYISITCDGEWFGNTLVGPDGLFAFSGIPAGEITLIASSWENRSDYETPEAKSVFTIEPGQDHDAGDLRVPMKQRATAALKKLIRKLNL
ncbi:hypothetical protein BH09SUM1_BH09SUM1_12450 [soil metagenome]